MRQVQTGSMRRPNRGAVMDTTGEPSGLQPRQHTYVIDRNTQTGAPDFACRYGPLPDHLQNLRSAELRVGYYGPCPFQTGHSPIGRSGIECCQPTFRRIQSSLRTESIPIAAVPGSSCRSGHDPGETLIADRRARRWAVPWSYEVKGVPKTPKRGPMPRVDHHPATGRNSCGSSTPRRTDDFHG